MKKQEKTLFIEFSDGSIKCAEHVTLKWPTRRGYAYIQGNTNNGHLIKYLYPKKGVKVRQAWEE